MPDLSRNEMFQLQNSNQAIEYAKECIRACILINGGAAVALLAFVSKEGAVDRDLLGSSLLWFCLGAGAGFVSTAGGYAAQSCFAESNYRANTGRPWEGMYSKAKWISAVFVIVMVFAICSFFRGIYLAKQSLFPPPTALESFFRMLSSLGDLLG